MGPSLGRGQPSGLETAWPGRPVLLLRPSLHPGPLVPAVHPSPPLCPLSSLRSPNTNPGDLGGTQPCKDTRHAALEVVCEVDETADLPLCLVCFGFVGSVSCKA